jgi:hypothetical protein
VANATVTIPELPEREVEVMHDELRVRTAASRRLLPAGGREDHRPLHTGGAIAEHRSVLLVLSVADAEGVELRCRRRAEIDGPARGRRELSSSRTSSPARARLPEGDCAGPRSSCSDRWLEHPEVRPLPLHDIIAAPAAVGDEHDHAHHGHDHHPPSGAAAAELDTRSETPEIPHDPTPTIPRAASPPPS